MLIRLLYGDVHQACYDVHGALKLFLIKKNGHRSKFCQTVTFLTRVGHEAMARAPSLQSIQLNAVGSNGEKGCSTGGPSDQQKI